ncbi:MAG TPA: AMP-binding protein [Solirubrobacterales bacterium]|jgi:crotonobetaine/carnitine-CoA ligase|nr:AMP-binding protein [Solirubrobacterales bacterium]
MTAPAPAHPPLRLPYPDRRDWTIPKLLADRARTHRDRPFVVDGDDPEQSWTYGEMAAVANSVGNSLVGRGFAAGDRLAIMLHNCTDFFAAWLGAAVAGIVEVPINVDYKGSFLEHVMGLTAPRGVVTSPALAPEFLASRAGLPDDLRFFVVDDGGDVEATIARLTAAGWAAENFDELLAGSPEPVDRDVYPHDLAAILSTSGTTGPSKGVMMPHAQLVFSGQSVVNVLRLGDEDVMQLANPLFHGNAQFMTVIPALAVGAKLVLFERFSPSRFLARIERHGITTANLLGAMMDWIWRQPPTEADAACSLRAVISCPTPASIAAGFQRRFGLEAIGETFGQTEIGLPFLTPYGRPRPDGAIGLPVEEFYEVALVDPETDEEVAAGEVGELVVRPRLPWIVSSGFWAMPEAMAAASRNMWFHSGDGLRRDERGWYHFTDRMKDTLRRRGENISSFEVEEALLGHPRVGECAIVAVPAEFEGGEDEVKAVIVFAEPVGWKELVGWAREKLPYFVVPRYWEAVEELPKTPTTKVRKAALREVGLTPATFDREAAGIEVSRSRRRGPGREVQRDPR